MSTQKRLESLIEVCISTALGFCVSFMAWPWVAYAYGYEYSVAANLGITGIFTVLSVARSYVVRRFFATGLHRLAAELARRVAKWL